MVDMTKQDNVNHPKHYLSKDIFVKCDHGFDKHIECIDITRNFNFNLGNAIKYIWRCDHKGNRKEDLQKAIWYLQDEINRIPDKGKQPKPPISAWCVSCQKPVESWSDHIAWHDTHGLLQPLVLEGCDYCKEGGVDQAHVLSCKQNPINQDDEIPA